MSPTPQDQPQTPSPQDLPVLQGQIDESSVVPATSVEKPQPLEQPSDALAEYEASKLDAPIEPDYSKIGITRPDRTSAENSGVSRGRSFAAALTGAAVLAGGAAAANILPPDSDSVTTTGSNTEQQLETTETVPSSDQNVMSVQPNPENVQSSEAVSNILVEESSVKDTVPSQIDTGAESDGNIQPVVQDISSERSAITQPGINDGPSVPDTIERTVVGPEAYPGEVTVSRSVSFAQFLMNNQQKTGILATREMSDTEYGTLTFSDPNGYEFTVTGRMVDGSIIVNDTLPMGGIGAITIIDSLGNQISAKSSKDTNVKPALSVTTHGQSSITTNQSLFPGIALDEKRASDEGATITADIDGYFARNFQR